MVALSAVCPWSGRDATASMRQQLAPHTVKNANAESSRLMSTLPRPGQSQVRTQKVARFVPFSVATQLHATGNESFARFASLRSIHGSAFAAAAADTASKASAAAIGSAAATAKRRFGLVVLAPTFLATHVTLAWALIPPIYLVLRQTSLANTLLAGPQGAWFLSRKVPHFVPDSLMNSLIGGKPELQAANDDAKANDKRAYAKQGDITVEELLERLARRGIRILWNSGSAIFSSLGVLRALGSDNEGTLARDAMRKLGGGPSQDKEEGRLHGFGKQVSDYAVKHTRNATEDIKLGQVRDGVAAWVIVKMLFPLRLPVALLATPRVARFLARAFAR